MPVRPLTGVLQCLRRTVLAADGPTDGELLERYRSRRDDTAFEMLLRRHAPMVWGVCRRVLGDVHDAEDAFQATFLVLVRKARSVRPAQMAGNWLHGVAYRTAMNAKANRSKRKSRETQTCCRERAAAEDDRSLERLVDQEVECLPPKYRSVLVLCDLEGKTRKQAARQLGCPEGTVAGRLARARVLLAKRLSRHGFALSGGALAVELVRSTASAGVPVRLVGAAIQSATAFALGTSAAGIPANVITLTKGVLKAMLLDKLKLAFVFVAVLLAGVAGTMTGLLPALTVAAAEPDDPVPQPDVPPLAADGKSQADRDPALQGLWSLERVLRDGKTITIKPGTVTLVVTHRYMIVKGDDDLGLAYKVNTRKTPKHIDLTLLEPGHEKGTKVLGVYAILADTLVIHEADGMRPRDTSFQGTMGSRISIYRRIGGISAANSLPVSPAAVPDATGAWANKVFEAKGSTSHDFGKVPRGTQVTHRFLLKNIYAVPIDITDTRVSCGCVTVTASGKTLQPNEEGHINVVLDTRRFSGPKAITIYVGVRGKGYSSTARLQVTGDSYENNGPVAARKELWGKVVTVDEEKRLVEVDIGTDQGLMKGQVLRILRLQPRAEFLGEVRIINVQANRAVGRLAPRTGPTGVRIGDDVGDLSSSP